MIIGVPLLEKSGFRQDILWSGPFVAATKPAILLNVPTTSFFGSESTIICLSQLLIGPFVQAIVDQRSSGIITVVLQAIACYAVFSLVFTVGLYFGELLRLDWRRVLQANLHGLYFKGRRAYALATIDKRIDNASQRITQDIDEMTNLAGQLLFGTFSSQ